MGTEENRRETDSGIEIKPVYTADDVSAPPEAPGEFPFTRGPYPTMYRGRPWTIRQYAGFASAEETNARFRYLLQRGQTGLSVAFDLPTQLGYDSDDPRALGEVGRTGVAIDSLADMEILFDQIPLGEVSTSMTINAPASLLLLLYELVAERQGTPGDQLRGTVQNDVLKEYAARGNYIFPPRPSMRITTDLFAYCDERLPRWNTISISGYHIREAGATAVQELAFTLANGIAYCQAAVDAGLSPDTFGERLSFFFNAHNHFFQEVAKFRAARRLWATIMRDRFGATNPKAQALRFHAQTGGSTLTAQQPESNIVRVAIQAMSAVAGGAQSIHTNGFDEALALPSERSARIALRTQQILAAEAGGTDTADPLGGAYFIEAHDGRARGARPRADRADRRPGRRGRGDRGRVHPARDRGRGVRLQPVDRVGRADDRRREQVRRGRRGGDRAALASTRRPSGARSSARLASGPSETPSGRGGARAGSRDRARRREPPPPDARGPRGALHGRRDLRRPPLRARDVRLASRARADPVPHTFRIGSWHRVRAIYEGDSMRRVLLVAALACAALLVLSAAAMGATNAKAGPQLQPTGPDYNAGKAKPLPAGAASKMLQRTARGTGRTAAANTTPAGWHAAHVVRERRHRLRLPEDLHAPRGQRASGGLGRERPPVPGRRLPQRPAHGDHATRT